MPTVRKLSPEELREMIEQEQQEDLATQTFGPALGPPTSGIGDRLEFLVTPRIGDVVQYSQAGSERRGIVLQLYGPENAWTALQLLVDGQRCWLTNGIVSQVLGRPRGISRIDHPARRTYGWYVRLYDHGVPRLARLFSDGQYKGVSASLEAALAFHAAASAIKSAKREQE